MSLFAGLLLACIVGVALTAFLGLLPWTMAFAAIALIVVLFYLATTFYWARDISARIASVEDRLRRLDVLADNTDRVDALEDRLIRLEGTRLRPDLGDVAGSEVRRPETSLRREGEDEGGQRTDAGGAT